MRGNLSPRCFDQMLMFMPGFGARGEGQKPTQMTQPCIIEADR